MNAPLIHIYTPNQSNRLKYVLNWIFEEQLQCPYLITGDAEQWRQTAGIKINYSTNSIGDDSLRIRPSGLLEEKDIRPQNLSVHRWKHSTILFYNQPGAEIPFDIFAAAFYLISRYEEYFPAEKDVHDRYRHQDSAAGQYAFLHQPVVDQWLTSFGELLAQKSGWNSPAKTFTWLPSYDIDMAWSYLHKSPKRQMGAYLKDMAQLKLGRIRERKAVLTGCKPDPYDSFERLAVLHKKYHVQPLFFFLLGEYSRYDKNIEARNPAMQQLIRQLAATGATGIHPSYGTKENVTQLKNEIAVLSEILDRPVSKSRQHYIRFSLPETYRALAACGIRDEYSMGYAGSNGFRAGTSNDFLWYDLEKEAVTDLRVHPFAFMEMTNKFYLRQNPKEAFLEWERLYEVVKGVKGTLISIWHNHSLGTDKMYSGWWECYEKMWALHFRS